MLTLDIENYATRCLKYVIIFVIIVIVKGIHGPKRTLRPLHRNRNTNETQHVVFLLCNGACLTKIKKEWTLKKLAVASCI